MPLQLPPPLQTPLHAAQGLLEEPSDPPTANDIVRASTNAHLVLYAHNTGGAVTAEEASAALEYAASVINAKLAVANTATGPADAPPPWFQAAIDRLNARLDQQQYAMSEIKRIAAISYNRTCITGAPRRFQEVSFLDGTCPTTDHHLPIIDSLQAIQDLTDNQLKRYHQLYCPLRVDVNEELPRPVCTREVLAVIGSSVGLIP